MMGVYASHTRRWHTGHTGLLAVLAISLALTVLAGCGVQLHPGGDELAFLRKGQLWVINPDGSLPRRIISKNVVGFAWSPDHHELVYRVGSGAYALASALLSGTLFAAPDAVADIGIVSINGGANAIQISPFTSNIERSDGWWDADGNRLLYREYPLTFSDIPPAPLYIDSQSDQPAGIARKQILDSAGIPTLAPDGMRVAVVDPSGALRVGAPDQQGAMVAHNALVTLPGAKRPARILWQPGHNALLFATANNSADSVTLRLLELSDNQSHAVVTLTGLLDVAFSPDGTLLLTHTASGLTTWRLTATGAQRLYTLAETDPLALAWWSPNERWLLLQDSTGMTLADAHTGAIHARLRYATALREPTPAAFWRPGATSPWSPDGSQIVFVSQRGATWQGKTLPIPAKGAVGLYVATPSGGTPALIDSNADTMPGWSYPDPSTTFLMAS
ncbi:MAG TPA: hypothetical protein VKQ36_00995 [Ktedonobacterales bacterium]|nr:hypothetical protein [Ktedonobacterales bacterium]